jgi:hypothetical protein
MSSRHTIPRSGFERDSMPLDAARAAFEWLVAGPHPVSVDGRLFPGLPARRVPLSELRDRLLRRRCPQALRDAVWAHLVLLARTEGGTWTVGCVGVALPALTSTAAALSARFAGDPSDIHAAVLAGFLAELATVNLRRPRIMLRLRWAAYRAGHTAVREALDAPVPSGHGFRSTTPPPPWGHPDFVLARAIAEGAITPAEAELIGATRLEGVPLADAAAERDLSYQAAKKARLRAEHRLVAYLLDSAPDTAHDTAEDSAGDSAADAVPGGASHHRHTGPREHDLATRVAESMLITDAAERATATVTPSHTVTGPPMRTARKAPKKPAQKPAKKRGARVSPQGRFSGVQGCGRRPATPAHTTPPPTPPPTQPELPPQSAQKFSQQRSGSTPGVSQCA